FAIATRVPVSGRPPSSQKGACRCWRFPRGRHIWRHGWRHHKSRSPGDKGRLPTLLVRPREETAARRSCATRPTRTFLSPADADAKTGLPLVTAERHGQSVAVDREIPLSSRPESAPCAAHIGGSRAAVLLQR